MKNKNYVLILFLLGSLWAYGQNNASSLALPKALKPYVQEIAYTRIGGQEPQVQIQKINRQTYYLTVTWTLTQAAQQQDWQMSLKPSFAPQFHWAPHLTPTDSHIIPQHVFRSPALLAQGDGKTVSLIPDVSLLKQKPLQAWYMDLDATKNVLTLGMAESKITDHVLYEKQAVTNFPAGTYRVAAYILISDDPKDIENPFAKLNQYMWKQWGKQAYAKGEPIGDQDMEVYVDHTYRWAFDHWREQVWQSFTINGKEVGAPTFIVNVTQSPNYPGEVNEREFRSIWNQAWFNSLRSASGLYRYARRRQVDSLAQLALKTKELALSFPQREGFFPGLIATEMEEKEIQGKKFWRSKGWDTRYFGNSNRNPFTWDAKLAPYHVLDMSYTAWIMLQWYTDLDADGRLLNYARKYADALLNVQRSDGYFPAWLDLHNLQDMQILSKSPESAMSVTFLLTLYEVTKESKYKDAALKAMQVLSKEIVKQGKWEDFETYWSCSRYGHDHLVDQKVVRNNMYKQNTLSMYYVAQAALASYKISRDKSYLHLGQRVLDELLMWQSTWQPSFIYIHAFGGFGVMNADAEWNDSRQSLFADLIIDYGKILKRADYLKRGLSALKASFVLMYCPENMETKEQWERRWPFLGQEDYGFMMENYGHDGYTSSQGIGIGEFTIYDWGNGAAAEAYNRLIDKWGLGFVKKR